MRTYDPNSFAQIIKTTAFSDLRTRVVKPGADGSVSVNLTRLDATETALARAALKELATITGLKFRETGGSAQITYRHDGSGANTKSTAYGGTITQSVINVADSRVAPGDAPGTFAFRTYMHETAHALGLGHPQDYGSIRDFARSKIANDSWQMSMMSYFDQIENTVIKASKAYHITPMLADYLALRQMYAKVAIHAGSTVYGVGSTAGGTLDKIASLGARATYLIADSSGTDHLNLASASAAQRIDLRPGAISSLFGGTGNMQIAPDTLIERATGGSGADVIIGNGAANILSGGAGNDSLSGGAGNDLLTGGAGRDTLAGGTGNDTYFADAADVIVEASGAGIDTVKGSGNLVLAAHVEHLELTGSGAANGTGNALANRLIGNAGANVLEGGLGNDTIAGGAGIDTALFRGNVATTVNLGLTGAQNTGHGTDVLTGIERVVTGAGADRLTGNAGANLLDAGAGNDTLDGGGGSDRLVGGAGNDSYVTDGGDTIIELAGQGHDTVTSLVSYTLGGHLEVLRLGGTAAINGTGNALANAIHGNSADNVLSGEAGDDQLFGGAGADRLIGGAGTDILDGGADTARDCFVFRAVEDSRAGAKCDVIRNFASGVDQIDLAGIDADAGQAGDQGFGFGGQTAAAFSVWLEAAGNDLILRADVTGDALSDFDIRLTGVSTLVAADLLL